MEPDKYEVGDTVVLKSGGPIMVVLEELIGTARPAHRCGWFSQGLFHSDQFVPEVLREAIKGDWQLASTKLV